MIKGPKGKHTAGTQWNTGTKSYITAWSERDTEPKGKDKAVTRGNKGMKGGIYF